jgi:hypothetical protein
MRPKITVVMSRTTVAIARSGLMLARDGCLAVAGEREGGVTGVVGAGGVGRGAATGLVGVENDAGAVVLGPGVVEGDVDGVGVTGVVGAGVDVVGVDVVGVGVDVVGVGVGDVEAGREPPFGAVAAWPSGCAQFEHHRASARFAVPQDGHRTGRSEPVGADGLLVLSPASLIGCRTSGPKGSGTSFAFL